MAPTAKPKGKAGPATASRCGTTTYVVTAMVVVMVAALAFVFVSEKPLQAAVKPPPKKGGGHHHHHHGHGHGKKDEKPSKFPKDYQKAVQSANELAMMGRRVEAAVYLGDVIKEYPDLAPAYYNLAQTYEDLFDSAGAKKYYHQALEKLDDEDGFAYDIHVNLALLYVADNDHANSVTHWRQAKDLQPKNPQALYSLGNALLESGEYAEAESLFRQCISLQRRAAQFHLGLARALKRLGRKDSEEYKAVEKETMMLAAGNQLTQLGLYLRDKDPDLAIRFLRRALRSKPEETYARTIVYTLGQIYSNVGLKEEEKKLYENAALKGMIPNFYQRPGIVIDSLLPSQPFPTLHDLPGLAEPIQHLEKNYKMFSEELVIAMQHQETYGKLFKTDNENLTDHGSWKQIIFVRDGVRRELAWASFPIVSGLLVPFMDGWTDSMPKASIEFSVLPPGEHIKPHAGPSNHRIRLHLGFKVPTPRNSARIRVANETRTWEEGKVLALDDSFDHEVWNDSDSPRIVMIVDIWHPSLSQTERQEIRRQFGWANKVDLKTQHQH